MKRCWFGLGLLVFLLAGGLLATRAMSTAHGALSARLDGVAASAMAEDWDGTSAQFQAARQEWERNWHFSAAFGDHEPMEDIDALFAEAEVYLHRRDPEAMATICARLARCTAAIGEAHALNWWNLL